MSSPLQSYFVSCINNPPIISMTSKITCDAGGEWYVCAKESKFVGCCSVNPCKDGCPPHAVSPMSSDGGSYDKLQDVSCGTTNFWICASGRKFMGCCKSNPCDQGGLCPIGDLQPAYVGLPEQFTAYMDPSINFVGAEPLTTSSVRLASGPIDAYALRLHALKLGRSEAFRMMGISISIMIVTCVGLMVWLYYRRLFARKSNRLSKRLVEKHAMHASCGPVLTTATENVFPQYN